MADEVITPNITQSPTGTEAVVKNPTATTPGFIDNFDEETKGYFQSKGITDATKMAEAFKQLEILNGTTGQNFLALPKDDNDTEAMGKIFDKLGRPKTSEEYEFVAKNESDKDFIAEYKKVFHEAGLTKAQANKVAGAYAKMQEAVEAKKASDYEASVSKAEENLKKLWGEGESFEAQRALAIAGKNSIRGGLTDAQLNAVEQAIGFDNAAILFAEIGAKSRAKQVFGEDSAPLTAGSAKQRMDRLLSDETYRKAYLAGDNAKVDEIAKLREKALGFK